tara:strand:+ start:222 stop:695 length:474 start_codon:yes stop_codon:yes gene_type:complete
MSVEDIVRELSIKDLKDELKKFSVKELKDIFREQKEVFKKYTNFSKLKKNELLNKIIKEHNKKTINLRQIISKAVNNAQHSANMRFRRKKDNKTTRQLNLLKKSVKIPARISAKDYGEKNAKELRRLKKELKNEGNFRDKTQLYIYKEMKKIIDSKK